MGNKVIIIHGWEGTPNSDWLPWLKEELEKEGVEAIVPSMPDTDHPVIKRWVDYLSKCIGRPDRETYLVGHSIGGQAALRYLETLGSEDRVGGVLLVASWIDLRKAAYEDKESEEIARPWIETPLDWEKIKSHTSNFTAILSDNDPYVPLEVGETFKKSLGAKVVVVHEKGHINDEFGVKSLSNIREELRLLMKDKDKTKQ